MGVDAGSVIPRTTDRNPPSGVLVLVCVSQGTVRQARNITGSLLPRGQTVRPPRRHRPPFRVTAGSDGQWKGQLVFRGRSRLLPPRLATQHHQRRQNARISRHAR